jgi:hypothetical protein
MNLTCALMIDYLDLYPIPQSLQHIHIYSGYFVVVDTLR